MAGSGIVLGGKPVLEAEVAGLRLSGPVEEPVAVPLATHAGGVSRPLEHGGHGELILSHVHAVARGDPVINSRPVGGPAGEQADPRWGAHRRGGVEVGEADTLCGEPVQVRGADGFAAVAGKVAVAKVIAEDHHDIGTLISGGCGHSDKQCREKNHQKRSQHGCDPSPVAGRTQRNSIYLILFLDAGIEVHRVERITVSPDRRSGVPT